MKSGPRSILILSLLCGYILLQFVWWEILLVKQNGLIIEEKQKLTALSTADPVQLQKNIELLQHRRTMQTVMIVSEGTVFLLLLLFGVYKVKQSFDKEAALNNQHKNFFLSITHELKTPIAATRLQLQTLQKQKLDETLRQELIAQAIEENERLDQLINNVLLSSRMDTPEFKYHPVDTDLSTFVMQLLNRYYKQELASGELSMDLEPGLRMAIDESTFGSVITNLTDNALKYSPEEKKVQIGLHLNSKKQIVLSTMDEGAGIPKTDREKIFRKFFRAGNEETRRTKGTGLGLHIVSQVVKHHKGLISVKDNSPKGTIFEITFL